ncbi:MAG TPA: CheR family methyltransferase, partial [Longimicrobium sp.]|nr:CheR family methyltransferase [Longimicrobium sp.]
EQWEVVRREAIPELVRLRAGRPLRAWSAACSTGEEAYTLAIVCQEEGIGAAGRSILGTDVSHPRLAAARAARYRRWALRDVPASVVAAYFTRRDDRWELKPALREGVAFRALNLVEDDWPSLTSGVREMDLVLCRNVLIYMDAPSVRRVAERLVATLSDGGWLFVGPSDPPLADFVECEVVVTPAGLAYRKHRRGTRFLSPRPAESTVVSRDPHLPIAKPAPSPRAPIHDARPSVVSPDPVAPHPVTADRAIGKGDGDADAERLYAARDYERAAAAAAARIARGNADEGTWIVRVRALANRGRLVEAEAACAVALERHRSSAELHDVHALLLAAAGRAREAAAALRQALYLDPSLIVAHVRMADVQGRLGSADAARRSLRNAESLLAALPAGAVVPSSDGMPAAHLLRTVRARLAMLTEGAA